MYMYMHTHICIYVYVYICTYTHSHKYVYTGGADNDRHHHMLEEGAAKRILLGRGVTGHVEEKEEEVEWEKIGVYMEGGSETRLEYMVQMCRGDLLMDTPLFNAHTTAVDALWVRVYTNCVRESECVRVNVCVSVYVCVLWVRF